MPKQRKSRSSQRTTVQATTAQPNARANSDCRPKHYVYFRPRATWCNQGHGSSPSLASKWTIFGTPHPHLPAQRSYRINSWPPWLPLSWSKNWQPSTPRATRHRAHLALLNCSATSARRNSLASDPSLPPVRNGGQQQIPSSVDFLLSSSQQDFNLGTPEDAALLHTNYRVPSIASHLSNSCIAAITNGEYVDLAVASSWLLQLWTHPVKD